MPRKHTKKNGEASTIFIADASPFDCQLLSDSLAHNHLQVLGWAVDSGAVIAAIAEQKPRVAVVSARLQDGELAGFRVLRQLRFSASDTRIVMLLDTSEPDLVVEAFRSGASGVFSRMRVSTDLRKCIRCVLEGEIWARHQEIRYVIEALERQVSPRIANSKGVALLTRREQDVVGLAVNGLTNREIATRLGLSGHTVKNYMFDIFEKLGISSRVELVLYALNHPPPEPAISSLEGITEENRKAPELSAIPD